MAKKRAPNISAAHILRDLADLCVWYRFLLKL